VAITAKAIEAGGAHLQVKDDELKEAVVVAMLVSPGRRVIA